MKLSFNVLKYNQFSEEPLEVDEMSFWRYYLEILQIKSGSFLSETETNVMAYVLAGVPNKSYFSSPTSKEMMEALDLSTHYLHKIKYDLQKKGVIIPTEIRGDYILSPRLADYQKEIKKYFQDETEIEYKFKFKKINLDDKSNNQTSEN